MAKYLVIKINIIKFISIIFLIFILSASFFFITKNNLISTKAYDIRLENYLINDTYIILETLTENNVDYVELYKFCDKTQLKYLESINSVQLENREFNLFSLEKDNIIEINGKKYIPLQKTLRAFSLDFEYEDNICIIKLV